MSSRRTAGVAAALAVVAVVTLFTLRPRRPAPEPAPPPATRDTSAPPVVAASRALDVGGEKPETRPGVEDTPAPPPWIELLGPVALAAAALLSLVARRRS